MTLLPSVDEESPLLSPPTGPLSAGRRRIPWPFRPVTPECGVDGSTVEIPGVRRAPIPTPVPPPATDDVGPVRRAQAGLAS